MKTEGLINIFMQNRLTCKMFLSAGPKGVTSGLDWQTEEMCIKRRW